MPGLPGAPLPGGAALELELHLAQLDHVVVDQVVPLHALAVDEAAIAAVEVRDMEFPALVADGAVLARDALAGQHHGALRAGADQVLAQPQAEVFALVRAAERHQPAAHRRALLRRVERDGAESLRARRPRHLLLLLQAVGADVPRCVHDVPVSAHLPDRLARTKAREQRTQRVAHPTDSKPGLAARSSSNMLRTQTANRCLPSSFPVTTSGTDSSDRPSKSREKRFTRPPPSIQLRQAGSATWTRSPAL